MSQTPLRKQAILATDKEVLEWFLFFLLSCTVVTASENKIEKEKNGTRKVLI